MKNLRRFAAAAVLLVLLTGLQQEAFGFAATPASLTLRTNRDSGSGCAACHTGAQDASVTISGPSNLKPGDSGVYTVTATKGSLGSGVKMGMAAASSDPGTPLSESAANLVVQSGEIIHSSAGGALNTTSGGSASYKIGRASCRERVYVLV